MAGKHEPDAKGSFYLSLATATLRAGLVIAAVVLGIFVLSRAFPDDPTGRSPQGAPSPTATSDEESPPPENDGGGDGGEQPPAEEEVNLRGVTVSVQNGTNVTGLAADTAADLRELGLRIPEDNIGNAARNFEVTTLFFAQGSRPQAEELNRTFFNGEADVQRMPADLEQDVQINVVLGQDYADAQG